MILPNIAPSVWESRPLLKDIRAEAHRRTASADAVLWSFLVMVAASIPPHVSLDTGVGMPARPNLFAVLAGASGTGKSVAWSVARALHGGAEPLPLSTGEGLIEAFYGRVQREQPQPDGKPPKLIWVRERVRSNALLWLDEGETLFKQAQRPGNILNVVLRSAWSGGTLGQQNATEGLSRVLEANTYTLGLAVGLQPGVAGQLLADTATGTAQRFVWASSTDVHAGGAPLGAAPLSGPLHWIRPQLPQTKPEPGEFFGANGMPQPPVTMTVDPAITRELHAKRESILRGVTEPDESDSQRPAMHAKVAAVLAWTDGRLYVTPEDWSLASALLGASDAVRDALIEHGEGVALAEAETEGRRQDRISYAKATAPELKEKCTARVAALLSSAQAPMAWSVLRRAVTANQREFLADVTALLVDRGVARKTERGYTWNRGVTGVTALKPGVTAYGPNITTGQAVG